MENKVSLGVVSRPVSESEKLGYGKWKMTAKVIHREILCFLSDDLENSICFWSFWAFSHSKGRSIYDLKEFPGQIVSVWHKKMFHIWIRIGKQHVLLNHWFEKRKIKFKPKFLKPSPVSITLQIWKKKKKIFLEIHSQKLNSYLFFFSECYRRICSTRIRGLTQEELGVSGARGSIAEKKPTGFINEAAAMQQARGSPTPNGKGEKASEEISSRRWNCFKPNTSEHINWGFI